MKVLVTGGNGFIGTAVVAELKSRGHEPVIFDRRQEAGPDFIVVKDQVTPAQVSELREALNAVAGDVAYRNKVMILPSGVRDMHKGSDTEFLLGDIRDATAVTEAVAHVDAVIHLAGVLGTAETITNPRPAAETNILGGLNVLEACTQYKTPLVNIAVGNWQEYSTYSITKTTVERFTKMYAKYRGTPACSVRAYNVYGPGQSVAQPYGTSRVRKIIPSFISRALHEEPIQVYGMGDQVMDMIYITDAANCLVTALEQGPKHGQVHSAGTGRRTDVRQIAEAVRFEVHRQTGMRAEIEHLPMRAGETPGSEVRAEPDLVRLTLKLDPDHFVKLEDGLKTTVAYYRELFR